jgi:hypothetical protein
MSGNEVLNEAWRIKDDLAREAGGDLGVFCKQLETWVESHPTPNRLKGSWEEIRNKLRAQSRPGATAVGEESEEYGSQ